MKLRHTLQALTLGLSFALAGAASAQSTLRIGLAEDPDVLDPTMARTLLDWTARRDLRDIVASAWRWHSSGR